MKFGILLRLVGVMNIILLFFVHFEENPTYVVFVKKKKPTKQNQKQKKTFNIGLHSDILQTDFFKTWLDDRDH